MLSEAALFPFYILPTYYVTNSVFFYIHELLVFL